jgi:AraC family transcriptional regulator
MHALRGGATGSAVLSCHAAEWGGLRLGHWRLSAGETAERVSAWHGINIPLLGRFTTVKQGPVGSNSRCYGDEGTICIVPAGQPVTTRWRAESECVSLFLDPALVDCAAGGGTAAARVEVVETHGAADGLLREIGLALLAESESDLPLGRLYAEALARTLALHLVRRYSVFQLSPALVRGGLSGSRLRRATEFVNEYLERDLSLADIAGAAGLSQFHFARAFKQTTGLTPHKYLTERRVERAKRLLAGGGLPLVEVASRSGFKNQSHFTTLFRSHTGLTPKAWRETKQG